MIGEITGQLAGLAIANREKEAVDDYIRDNWTSLDDFAEIQSAYAVFFCGVAGANPMPLRQQQRYASQRIMQVSLSTLLPPTPPTTVNGPINAIDEAHIGLSPPSEGPDTTLPSPTSGHLQGTGCSEHHVSRRPVARFRAASAL